MKNMKTIWMAPISLAFVLAGCATPNQQPYYSSGQQPGYGAGPAPSQNYPAQEQIYQLGYVDRIEVVNRGAANNAAGTIIGGIIGGLIGTQIGSGSGRTAGFVKRAPSMATDGKLSIFTSNRFIAHSLPKVTRH